MRSLALMLALVSCFVGVSLASAQRHHTVRAGQTLAAIAQRYRVSVRNLAAANRLTNRDRLRPGMILSVPSRGVHYVCAGDTLARIARRNDCSVRDLMRLNRLSSSSRVRVGQRLILPGYHAYRENRRAAPRDWGEPAQPGVVQLQGRLTSAEVRLVDDEGRVLAPGLRELASVMRREPGDAYGVPNPRLAALVALISDHFGGRPVTVVSGWREARARTRETSRHVSGDAADIRVQGVPNRVVWEFCRSLRHTGCGFYPRSVFVHVDTREREATWVDWSAPGRRSRYGTLRGPARRRGRRPRVGRRITRPNALPLNVQVIESLPAMPVHASGDMRRRGSGIPDAS